MPNWLTIDRRRLIAEAHKAHGGAARFRAAPLPQRTDPPQTRSDCEAMPRPCPFVACRYHLFLDVTKAGSIQFPFGDDVSALFDMKETCALDVADKGTHTRRYIASIFNLGKDAVALKEEDLMVRLRSELAEAGPL